jgi:hypothetical protein
MRACAILLALTSLAIACSDAPTAPSGRTGTTLLRVRCDNSGTTPLICVAQASCVGGYPCNDPAGEDADITARAEWTVGDPTVLRQLTPNTFLAVGPGNTVVRVRDPISRQEQNVRVSVFPGTAPLLTAEVWGRVTDAGTRAEISGAVIEIRGALIGSRTSISGTDAELIPGYFFLLRGSNGFQFFGVPRGTYETSVSANGYAPQTRTVMVDPPGGPSAIFELVRQ